MSTFEVISKVSPLPLRGEGLVPQFQNVNGTVGGIVLIGRRIGLHKIH